MSNVAVRADNLSKRYRIGSRTGPYRTLRESLTNLLTAPARRVSGRRRPTNPERTTDADDIWALKDVSFDLEHGEVVGIIGRNGAGKSTLLKILSRVTEPTAGRVELYGRVGSLLEVGTGFHPELTGRDNIYLNGAILGMSKADIRGRFDEIVAFAELERFLDTPVKRYSSGMYMRLAFSVAAHLEPDILLVDEVLAVGDIAFRNKCLGRMHEVAKAGRTVILVSHDMATVQSLCQRALLFRQGHLTLTGPVDLIVREYLAYLADSADSAFAQNPERSGGGEVRLTAADALDESQTATRYLIAGRPAAFRFRYQNPAGVRRAHILFTIFNQLGVAATHFDMRSTNFEIEDLGLEGEIICHIQNLPLPVGQYRVAVSAQVNGQDADLIPNALVFDVASSVFYPGANTPDMNYCSCMILHEWSHSIDKSQPSQSDGKRMPDRWKVHHESQSLG